MRLARITRILEIIGDYLPGVHELTLLVPAFFGMCSAARALGLDVDLGPAAVAVVSVTFSCFVWMILNGLWPATSAQPIDCGASTQCKKETTTTHAEQGHGPSAHHEKHYPAGLT